MKSFLPVLLPFALAPLANAQEPRDGPRQLPIGGPFERVVHDVETGRSTRLRSHGESRSPSRAPWGIAGSARAQSACFLNTRTMGFFSSGTTGAEWRDWATKATGKTGLITRFFFAYATAADGPPLGGPGASIEVAFYQGETGFCTKGGQEIPGSRFLFTGLRARSSTIASNMGRAFLVTALVPTNRLFCAPDGRLGWSYGFVDDDDSGDSLTGPIMTSFVSENTGAADAYDIYNRRPRRTALASARSSSVGASPCPSPCRRRTWPAPPSTSGWSRTKGRTRPRARAGTPRCATPRPSPRSRAR